MASEWRPGGTEEQVPSRRERRPYDTRSAARWIVSHLRRYPLLTTGAIVLHSSAWWAYGLAPIMVGRVAAQILEPATPAAPAAGILVACLWLLVILAGDACLSMAANACTLTLAHRIERDARDELYRNLLGKSQTYHDRQRIGDLVARATDDSRMLSMMIHPGILFISDMVMGFITPIVYILLLDAELMIVPVLYAISFAITLRAFVRKLGPVLFEQRRAQGELTAALEEAISGIEVVKVSVREAFERGRFGRTVSAFKELFVRSNRIEGFYVPMLIYGALAGLALLHGVLALQRGVIGLDGLIAFVGLMHALRIPTFISAFSFSMLQGGIAGARRILSVLKQTTGIDQNTGGVSAPIEGAISFQGVNFGYEGSGPVLTGVDLDLAAGETVAIVGQTGSGKSSLTRLVNRTYDPTHGSVRVDGIDLRTWNLESLRSQIASVEQDVFLFSRSIADNIAFARPGASRVEIEAAARAAAADEFIGSFNEGYDTVIGERGVTLSGGQRQRLALARAFLKDPRILILDDSTSAIDSATEDEIQRALTRIQRGRTTLIVTHRLSQIRWADRILVLDGGRLVANGTHRELLAGSRHYRRIFSRYDLDLPPLADGAAPGAPVSPNGIPEPG